MLLLMTHVSANFLLQGKRDADAPVNTDKAWQDAEALKQAGVDKLGTDENKFIEIFACRNFPHLRVCFGKYKQVWSDLNRTARKQARSQVSKFGGAKYIFRVEILLFLVCA